MMELNNAVSRFSDTTAESMAIKQEAIEVMVKCLSPVMPHVCHHLWFLLGGKEAIVNVGWPEVDKSALVQENVQIMAQVNGKLRARIMAPLDSENQTVQEIALKDEKVKKFTEDKKIIKVVIVPNKLINIVVKD